MPSPIANRINDVGVKRDPVADTNTDVESLNLVTSIGVNVATPISGHLRDLPSMPAGKTKAEKDGPTPFNPNSGKTGSYQR